MSGTHGSLYADLPHQGGWIFYDANNLFPFSSNLVLTRNALGDYSFNRTAAGAETYQVVLSLADLKRLIEVPTPPLPYFEFAGTSALGPNLGQAGAPGVPPFKGMAQFTSPTGQPPKGLRILDCVAIYLVTTQALTAASLSLNRTQFANNVANAITNLPLQGTAPPLATQANPYVVKQTVTTPVFETSDLSDISLEFAFTMQNGGVVRVYGLGVHVDFNFN